MCDFEDNDLCASLDRGERDARERTAKIDRLIYRLVLLFGVVGW